MGTVESSTFPQPVTGSRWRTCEISTLYLENCANARQIYVFEWLTLYSRSLRGYGRIVNLSATCNWESLTYQWNFNSIYLENCANARRIYVFWVINPLFSTPPGGTVESSTFLQPVTGSRWRTCEVSTLCLENWVNTCRINVFEWLTLYSQALWGTIEPSTPPLPAPETPWPVWEVWTSYLENCANARWIYVFWVINPLFLTPPGVR